MLVMNISKPAGTESLISSSAASICNVGSKLKQPCQLTYQVSHISKSADFTLKRSSCSASNQQDCGSELNTSEITPFRLFNTAFPMHGLDCPKRRDFHVQIYITASCTWVRLSTLNGTVVGRQSRQVSAESATVFVFLMPTDKKRKNRKSKAQTEMPEAELATAR